MKKELLLCGTFLVSLQLHAQNIKWIRKSAPTAKETYGVTFSNDGSKVFSGSECSPSFLRIFDIHSGDILWDYQVDSVLMCVQGVKFSSNSTKVAAIEELGNLLIFDYTTTTPTLQKKINIGTNYSFATAFSPDGKKIAVACSDNKLMVYDADNGAQLHNVAAHNTWALAIDWNINEKIATCGNDNMVKIWDSACNLLKTINAHSSAVNGVKFSPNGNYVVSCSKDKTVKIWDASSGSPVRTLTGHTDEVKAVDISDDGTKIVSGCKDGSIKIWDFNTGNLISTFTQPGCGIVYAVEFSPNGQYLIAGTANGDVQLWDFLFATGIKPQLITSGPVVYPNPCKEVLNIETSSALKSMVVYDAAGRKVMETGCVKYINTLKLPAGSYILNMETENGPITATFVKSN